MKVIHELPGRFRLEIQEMHRSPHLAERIERLLLREPGISKVVANAGTGRLLVCYGPDQNSLPRLRQKVEEILTLPGEVKAILDKRAQTKKKDEKAYRLEKLPLGSQLGLTLATGLLLLLGRGRRTQKRSGSSDSGRFLDVGTITALLTGLPVFQTALDRLWRHKQLSSELLAGTATLASLVLDEDNFGLSVLFLVYLNTLIRTAILESARDRIRVLLEGKTPLARLATPQGPIIVPGEQLARNSLFHVKAGERLPADGVVERGSATVNLFPIEGGRTPHFVEPGAPVYAGSQVVGGHLSVRATQVGVRTRIGQLIQHLQAKKKQPGEEAIRLLNQMSLLPLVVAGGYYLATKNAKGALNIVVVGMPCAAGQARAIPSEIGAIRALASGALIKSGKDLARLGATDLLLVENGSFLAADHPANQQTVSTLKELNYRFPPLPALEPAQPGQTEAEQIIQGIRGWQKQGHVVGMIGAGAGNTPPLSAADIGIAQTTADDLHLKSAAIILTEKDRAPQSLTTVAHLARNARKIANQNSLISSGCSFGGMLLGVLSRLNMAGTGLIQNVSNLVILANSARMIFLSADESDHLKRQSSTQVSYPSAGKSAGR